MKRELIRSYTVALRADAIVASLAPTYASALTGSVAGTDTDSSAASTTPSLLRNQLLSESRHAVSESEASGAVAQSPAAKTKKQAAVDKYNVTNLTSVTISRQLSALRQEAETRRDAIGVVDSISAETCGNGHRKNREGIE